MTLRDVVVYGLIYMVPMAPVAVFGTIHSFATAWPPWCTSWQPSRWCSAPSAIARWHCGIRSQARCTPTCDVDINPFAGFLSGWAILLDYLLLPALLSVFAAIAMTTLLPGIPAWAWIVSFVLAAAPSTSPASA